MTSRLTIEIQKVPYANIEAAAQLFGPVWAGKQAGTGSKVRPRRVLQKAPHVSMVSLTPSACLRRFTNGFITATPV